MGVDWYNAIARKNGGYKSNAMFITEGESPEQLFENELIQMLPQFQSVLDAGCGHGDFTIKMAAYTKFIIGFDNAHEMIQIANDAKGSIDNVQYIESTTKAELPFQDEQFDLIYNRRGPTSIINHSRILKRGGTIFGIHSGALELVIGRLNQNQFMNIEIREYNQSRYIFDSKLEYAKFVSGIPGNPDFLKPEMKTELELLILKHWTNGRIEVPEYKYIWKATKP
jgi:SAM-dependent methyltransferase